MKVTVAKINDAGHEYRVIFDTEKKTNPYTIHKKWMEHGEHGLTKRTKKLIDYAGLTDCMYHITWIVEGRITE